MMITHPNASLLYERFEFALSEAVRRSMYVTMTCFVQTPDHLQLYKLTLLWY